MKRVLHVAQAPGGVERYLLALLKKLNKDEYENILVCSHDYQIEKFKEFVNIIECVEMHREINLLQELNTIIHLRKIIKKYNPDIVYFHSSKAGADGRIANWGLKNISIYNAHGWAFNMKCKPLKQITYAFIERAFAPLCTKIVAISDFEKQSAIDRRICKEEKIQVIYNGIDFDEYVSEVDGKCTSMEFIPKNACVIGCVGRLTTQKAPDIFIKAASIIKESVPNTFFLMVGDGEQRELVESLIKEYKLNDCVLITGWVDNPLSYIEKFDVALLLSRWEGFGLALPEYMIKEKPIIATKVDAIPNIITDGWNGLLVEVDDFRAVAQKVLEIFQNEELSLTLKKNGLNSVKERFNVDRVANEHENLFASLLSQSAC